MKRIVAFAIAAMLCITAVSAVYTVESGVVSDGVIAVYGGFQADNLRDVVIAKPSVIIEPLVELTQFAVYDMATYEQLDLGLPEVYETDELAEPYYIDAPGEYLVTYAAKGSETKQLRLVVVSGNSFSDTNSHWASGEICYATDLGWFRGTGDGMFSPDASITRAQAVTALWRVCGEPDSRIWSIDPDYRPFVDVSSAEYYTNAVSWAMSVGIAAGTGSGMFQPSRPVTRAEFAALLLRTLQYNNPSSFEGPDSSDAFYEVSYNMADFNDSASVEAWARAAIGWAYANDILRGDDKGNLNPNQPVTRAEAAVMLFRALR